MVEQITQTLGLTAFYDIKHCKYLDKEYVLVYIKLSPNTQLINELTTNQYEIKTEKEHKQKITQTLNKHHIPHRIEHATHTNEWEEITFHITWPDPTPKQTS